VIAPAVERDHDRPRLARAERHRDDAEARQLGARVSRRGCRRIGEIELPRETCQRRGRSRRFIARVAGEGRARARLLTRARRRDDARLVPSLQRRWAARACRDKERRSANEEKELDAETARGGYFLLFFAAGLALVFAFFVAGAGVAAGAGAGVGSGATTGAAVNASDCAASVFGAFLEERDGVEARGASPALAVAYVPL
jgi:hypothetical protein